MIYEGQRRVWAPPGSRTLGDPPRFNSWNSSSNNDTTNNINNNDNSNNTLL